MKLRHIVLGAGLLWGLSAASESDAQWARTLALPQLRSYYENAFADYNKPPLRELLQVTGDWLVAAPARISSLWSEEKAKVDHMVPENELYSTESGLNMSALGTAVLKATGKEVPEELEQLKKDPNWSERLLNEGIFSQPADRKKRPD